MSCTSRLMTYGLAPNGHPTICTKMSHVLEKYWLSNPTTTTLLLNRPQSLHSLTVSMCGTLYARLVQLHRRRIVCVVLASTTPKVAFCAGGDVLQLSDQAHSGLHSPAQDFCSVEYRLISLLACVSPHVVSILDGAVMGGGAGLSIHGTYRVATENTIFAMPEVLIGLHPDVGGSYFLSRLSPGLGAYIALTAARIKGQDAFHAGLATHFIRSSSIPKLMHTLQSTPLSSQKDIEAILQSFVSPLLPSSEFETIMKFAREFFTLDSVQDIVQNLQNVSVSEHHKHVELASKSLQMMRRGCPTSLKVTFESLRRGASMSLNECLKMEYRLSTRLSRRTDFKNGVHSVLILKDRKVSWNPDQLQKVEDKDIQLIFRSLMEDLKLPELDLVHHLEVEDRQTTKSKL